MQRSHHETVAWQFVTVTHEVQLRFESHYNVHGTEMTCRIQPNEIGLVVSRSCYNTNDFLNSDDYVNECFIVTNKTMGWIYVGLLKEVT